MESRAMGALEKATHDLRGERELQRGVSRACRADCQEDGGGRGTSSGLNNGFDEPDSLIVLCISLGRYPD